VTSSPHARFSNLSLLAKSTSTSFNAANFLGLAEIRLASGDTPGALDLLHRLVAVVGNPLENLDPAAALLEKAGHNAEAIEFLDPLVKSAPWDASYRLRLAKARIAAGRDVRSFAGCSGVDCLGLERCLRS